MVSGILVSVVRTRWHALGNSVTVILGLSQRYGSCFCLSGLWNWVNESLFAFQKKPLSCLETLGTSYSVTRRHVPDGRTLYVKVANFQLSVRREIS